MPDDKELLRDLVIILLRNHFVFVTFDEKFLKPAFDELNISTYWIKALSYLYNLIRLY